SRWVGISWTRGIVNPQAHPIVLGRAKEQRRICQSTGDRQQRSGRSERLRRRPESSADQVGDDLAQNDDGEADQRVVETASGRFDAAYAAASSHPLVAGEHDEEGAGGSRYGGSGGQ